MRPTSVAPPNAKAKAGTHPFRFFCLLAVAIFALSAAACSSFYVAKPQAHMLDRYLKINTSHAETTDEQWYAVYECEKKTGWFQYRAATSTHMGRPVQVHTQTLYQKYYRRGQSIEKWHVTKTVHDEQDRLVAHIAVAAGGNEASTIQTLNVEQKQILVTTRRGETVDSRKIDYNQSDLYPFLAQVCFLPLEPQSRLPIQSFDFEKRTIEPYQLEVAGRTKITMKNKALEVWHVQLKKKYRQVQDLYLSADGNNKVIKIAHRQKPLVFFRTSESEAKDRLEKYDFNETFDLKMGRDILAPWSVTEATIALTNHNLDTVLIEDQWQVRQKAYPNKNPTWTFHARRVDDADADDLPLTLPDADQYLNPTFFIQSDDQKIRQTALRIRGQENNALRVFRKISMWVYYNIKKKNLATAFASAAETLDRLEGDCTEHSVLTVALARAVGIPARIAIGLVYADGRFTYHMWAEGLVAEDLWAAVDPAMGQIEPDALHLKFYQGDLDLGTSANLSWKLIQSLKADDLEIVEIKKSGDAKPRPVKSKQKKNSSNSLPLANLTRDPSYTL